MEKKVQEGSEECHKKRRDAPDGSWLDDGVMLSPSYRSCFCGTGCRLWIGGGVYDVAVMSGDASFMMKSMHKKSQQKTSGTKTGTGDIETGV